MGLKDILVHLDSSERSKARLGVAADLAHRFNAYLTGLFVLELPQADYLYGSTMAIAGSGPERIVAQMRVEAVETAGQVETYFRDRLRMHGVRGAWIMTEGNAPQVLAHHARYVDVTVVGQTNHGGPGAGDDRNSLNEVTLLTSGRPILAIPYVGEFQSIGHRVMVAWNGSREATRAVNDAMPLLEAAERVTVLAVNPRRKVPTSRVAPGDDITAHMVRHGVRAEAANTRATDISDGEALLSYAADISADLIVCGGYGHSRALELVFGGVTRTLLREMTVPVFMSH